MKNPDDDNYEEYISHLIIRENPPMPSAERLLLIYSLNYDQITGDTTSGFVKALQAIWRDGCDAGMVAP